MLVGGSRTGLVDGDRGIVCIAVLAGGRFGSHQRPSMVVVVEPAVAWEVGSM